MLNAPAIAKLLLDDEPPVTPDAAADPFDAEDPEAALSRYMAQPFKARGSPVNLYQRWKEALKGRPQRKVKPEEKIGRSCWLIDRGEVIALRVYDTDVVTVNPENRVQVDMNGFWSQLSCRAVNWASPGGWQLFGRRKRGLDWDAWTFYWWNYHAPGNDRRVIEYTDGDYILPDGTLEPQANPDYTGKIK